MSITLITDTIGLFFLFCFKLDEKCPFSSGKPVVDALQMLHPTPAMKAGSVLSQPTGVRQLMTMPLSAQGWLS